MKIKTITCHNVYNFGASLQAYALMTYLTSQGHQVEIIDYMPDYIRKNLSLWAIGPVRENSGLKILYNLGIKKGVHVVDPVFLLSSNQWMQLATLPIYNNYILVYDQENNATIKKIALYLSKKSGKKIVAFKDLYPRTYADYQERYAGPTEFIGLIAKADIVITNSFHCSAFSIIMNRQFYVIPRTHQKVNSRMENLLSSLEIRNRFITSIEDINNATEIDYNKVTPLIESMKEQSYKYISNVLASQSNS